MAAGRLRLTGWPLLLAVGAVQAACLGGSTSHRSVDTGTTPSATATERFRAVSIFTPNCPADLPVKVGTAGQIVAPTDPAYATTQPTRCYGRVADAQADGYGLQPAGGRAGAATPAVPATPVSVAAAATAILARLSATPITAEELPSGITMPHSGPGTAVQDINAPIADLIGELDIHVSGPDSRNLIAYLIFPSDDEAASTFAVQNAGHGARDPVIFTPSGMGYLTRCTSGSVPASGGTFEGTTVCYVRIGYVEVVGLSAVADVSGPMTQGNPDRAIALARAGVEHFLRVQRQSNR